MMGDSEGGLGECGGGEVLGRPEQWGPSEQGPEGRQVSSVLRPSSQQLSWCRVPPRSVPAQGLPMEALGPLGSAAEATGTAVTPVPTTGALAVGAAGPAPLAVWAAGLVIVAEVPRPTFHVPRAHKRAAGQAEGRVCRVHLLLTGSGLHIAGVASRAAVLAVLTAHGVWQLTAGPGPPQTRAAGLPHRAAGVLVTAHVSGVGRGGPAGRHLVQSGHHLVPPLTVPSSHTRIALRAAVLVVQAADSLWGRTAAPLPRRESTAGSGGRTAGDVITGDIPLHGSGVRQADVGWGFLHPRHPAGPLLTHTLLCVTPKPGRAAVHVVLTAHGLHKRAAAPGPGL